MYNIKYLYHITKSRNVLSILTCGLKSNTNKAGFVDRSFIKEYYKKYNTQPVFLTSDVEFIIKTQLTDKWMFDSDAKILRIDVSGLVLEYEYDYLIHQKMINNSKHKTLEHLERQFNSPSNPLTFIHKGDVESFRITLTDL